MPVPKNILDTIDYYRARGLDDKAITDKMIAANIPGISQTVSMYQNKGFSPDMILERMRQPNEGAGPGATSSTVQPGDLIAGAVPGVAGAVRKGIGKLAGAADVMLPRVAQAGGRIAGSVATHLPLGASPIGSETPKVTYQEIGRILAGKEGNTGSLTDILKNAGRKVFGGEAPPAPATVNPQAESVVQNAMRRQATAPATPEGGLQPPVRTPTPQQPSNTLGGPESAPTQPSGITTSPPTAPGELENIMQSRAAQVPKINAAQPSEVESILGQAPQESDKFMNIEDFMAHKHLRNIMQETPSPKDILGSAGMRVEGTMPEEALPQGMQGKGQLYMFTDPKTGSTLAMHEADITPEALQVHLTESRAKFGAQ